MDRLPLAFFDRQTYGEILSKGTNDVDSVSLFITRDFKLGFKFTLYVCGNLGDDVHHQLATHLSRLGDSALYRLVSPSLLQKTHKNGLKLTTRS